MGRAWTSLRALLPSWRFFDDMATPLALWVRDARPWRELPLTAPRPWYALFFNPRGNFGLLLYGTLERLLSELAEDACAPERLVSYQLVRHLAASATEGDTYQFQIRAGDEPVLTSLLHTRSGA